MSFCRVHTLFWSVSATLVGGWANAETASAPVELDKVSVTVTKEEAALPETGFNVNELGTEELLNSSKDIEELLNESAGINIRKTGGLGSSSELSLNGLSGNKVRYFIDGIPMENIGSALSVQNFPMNLATNVQVYKGVVPSSMSTDAIGGVINIETPDSQQDFVDASYSYGSFNTHRIAVAGQKSYDSGAFLRLSSFYNDTDNSYEMVDVPVQDELGNKSGTRNVKRFHDDYSSGMVNLKAGVIDKLAFDELTLSFTHAENYNEQQHPARSTNRVFGDVYSFNDTQLLSLSAKKYWTYGQFKGYVMKGQSSDTFHDTTARRYNWSGDYRELPEGYGEFGTASVFTNDNDITRGNFYGQYDIHPQHSLGAGLVYSRLERSGEDKVNPVNTSNTDPNWLTKKVASFSYDYQSAMGALDLSLFSKLYSYEAESRFEEYRSGGDVTVEHSSSEEEVGYGVGALYDLSLNWVMRASYELAYRIPEATEILGDGNKYVRPNPDLNVEQSSNYNLGVVSRYEWDSVLIKTEVNGFYRDAKDFITFNQDRVISGIYENIGAVEISGVEFTTRLKLFDQYSLDFNLTQQSKVDKTRINADGEVNDGFGEELPNEPSLFGNLRLGSRQYLMGYQTGVYVSSHYVSDFDLYNSDYGDPDTKKRIPSQLYHDIEIEASSPDNRYHVGFLASNVTDELLYDNFDVQKPGRAFYLKLRYSTR